MHRKMNETYGMLHVVEWPNRGCLVCMKWINVILYFGCRRHEFYDVKWRLMIRVEVVMVTGCFESQHDLNIVPCFDENNVINVWNYWCSGWIWKKEMYCYVSMEFELIMDIVMLIGLVAVNDCCGRVLFSGCWLIMIGQVKLGGMVYLQRKCCRNFGSQMSFKSPTPKCTNQELVKMTKL